MASLDPYLHFNEYAKRHLLFINPYSVAGFSLCATKILPPNPQIKPEEAEQVMHVSLPIGRSTLMGSDFPSAMVALMQALTSTLLLMPIARQMQTNILKAAAGGKVGMPMAHQFGAATSAWLPINSVHWMISFNNPT